MLDDPAKVTGAVHRMTWTATSGFSSANSFVLPPKTVGATRGGYGVVGLQLANVLGSIASPSEIIVGTISGEILALDTALGSVLWRATVPGAAGCFNAIHVADVDGDGMDELYVCGSFGIWRFKP
jgi:outer membrane protein assembly factor BamB